MKKSLEEINRFCSGLSPAQIAALSDDEISELALERPGHPEQYGFMLSLEYFRSQHHLSETMAALMLRLGQVKRVL